jgi:hypothetical protein
MREVVPMTGEARRLAVRPDGFRACTLLTSSNVRPQLMHVPSREPLVAFGGRLMRNFVPKEAKVNECPAAGVRG